MKISTIINQLQKEVDTSKVYETIFEEGKDKEDERNSRDKAENWSNSKERLRLTPSSRRVHEHEEKGVQKFAI